MKWYAEELGFGADVEYWGIVGLLHDIDFELLSGRTLYQSTGTFCARVESAKTSYMAWFHMAMELPWMLLRSMRWKKYYFAADELTGLIWAAALMRPSKSTKDMELKSLKKKYKSKGFAAGCSREVIERGAEQLGWELDKLLTMTLEAMKATEDEINTEIEK